MFQLYVAAAPTRRSATTSRLVQSDMGDVDTAIETIRAALYRHAWRSGVVESLARCWPRTGASRKASPSIRRAIRLDPNFSRSITTSAMPWSHLGQLDKELDCYNESLVRAVDPTGRWKASIRAPSV